MGDLGPEPVTVTRDPTLIAPDTAAISAAAQAYLSASAALVEVAKKLSSVAEAMDATAAWKGLGEAGFSASAKRASQAAMTASGALQTVGTALNTLAEVLDSAVTQALQAEAQALQVNTETNQLNAAYEQRIAELDVSPSAMSMIAPTPAEMAASSRLFDYAKQAQKTMADANSQAQNAWKEAAAAFDEATSEAPSLRAVIEKLVSVADAAARAKVDDRVWKGIGDFAKSIAAWLGDAVLGTSDVLQAGMDPLTDAATGWDTLEAIKLAHDGISLIWSHDGSTPTITGVKADGVTVNSEIVNDVNTNPNPQTPKFENLPGAGWVWMGGLNGQGHATGIVASITSNTTRGKSLSGDAPGYGRDPCGKSLRYDNRGHLLAAQLGGPDDPRNNVTLFRPANAPTRRLTPDPTWVDMRTFENKVRRLANETVNGRLTYPNGLIYSVVPVYADQADLQPSHVLMLVQTPGGTVVDKDVVVNQY